MLKLKIHAIGALEMPEETLEAENTMEMLDPYLQRSPVTGKYKGIFGRMRRAARYTGLPMWGILRNKAMQSSAWLCDQLVRNGLAEWIAFSADEFDPKQARKRQRIKAVSRSRTTEEKENDSARQKRRWENMTEEQKKEIAQKYRDGWAARREKIAKGEIVPKPRKKRKPYTAEEKQKASERFLTMTPEQKAERSARLKAGWAARRERLAKEREQSEKQIEQERAERHNARIYANKVKSGRIPNASEIPAWFVMPKGGIETKND